jgi:outer membrane protein insertion porin family
VRRVAVGGNNKTRDEVIRREFRQFEASWYDGDKIKLSRDRVDRLGFFTEVNVETQEVPGSPDQVDLTVNVAEKPTGSLQLGAGYSSAEKVALTFGISQENVFGSGNFLGVQVNTSKYNRTLSLTTTDPYFTKDGISRTMSVYHTTTRPYNDSVDGDYKLVNQGASIRFGVPFSEVDTVFFGVGLERYAFDPNADRSPSPIRRRPTALLPVQDGCDRPDRRRMRPEERVGRAADHRLGPRQPRQRAGPDDRAPAARQPRAGRRRRHEVHQDELPVPAVLPDQQAVHLRHQRRGRLRQGVRRQGLPDLQELLCGWPGLDPRLRAELAGPARRAPLLGQTEGAALGGTKKAIFNAELSTPFPGAGNDRTLRLYGFFDVGNVFGSRGRPERRAVQGAEEVARLGGPGHQLDLAARPAAPGLRFPVKSQKEVLDPPPASS